MPNPFKAAFAWFRNLFIRVKIMVIFLPLILIPLLILGYVSNNIYKDSIIGKSIGSTEDNLRLITTRVQGMFVNAESAANMLTINLNRFLDPRTQPPSGSNIDLRLYTQITNQLSYGLLVFPDVEAAVFVDMGGHIYGTTPWIERTVELKRMENMVESIDASAGENLWFDMEQRTYLTTDPTVSLVTIGKKVTHIQSGRQLGRLFLLVKESDIRSVFETIGRQEGSAIVIADASGNVISAQEQYRPNPEIVRALQSKKSGSLVEQGTVVVRSSFPKFGWQFVSMTPLERLTQDTRKVSQAILLIGIGCLVAALAGAAVLSSYIAAPLKLLTRSMRKVRDGQLDTQLEVRSNDETGILASGFNEMTRQIVHLIDTVEMEQRQKREFELALIQTQIRPHFLYNTLDVIYALAEMGLGKEVQKTTKALADFYRVALSSGREFIPIRDEVKNVQDYLKIQRIRYSDVFTYEVDIHPDIFPFLIPKLTIQPLVENAIYHGLKTRDGMGLLRITGRLVDGNVRLSVWDNGIGIVPDKLSELRASMQSKDRGDSYGLLSVNERIRLYYREQSGIRIDSEAGEWTEIVIEIPAVREEESEGND